MKWFTEIGKPKDSQSGIISGRFPGISLLVAPKKYYRSWWIPSVALFAFILILSIRQLSDPDLGFHLKYGKWIVSHAMVPDTDLSTYTVKDNKYVDLHWMFQSLVFLAYRIIDYNGLSLLVTVLSITLLFLLEIRLRNAGIHPALILLLLLTAFLIMEARLILRPELITFCFAAIFMILLERYQSEKSRSLLLLPVLQLIWCNMHGLFILGLIMIGCYLLGISLHERRIDKKLAYHFMASVLVCFLNPWFFDGFIFPFRLMTRFSSTNIFHQHISEFRSFMDLDSFNSDQLIFILALTITLLLFLLTFRKRRIHEWMLLLATSWLSLAAVRNLPLFAIITLPTAGICLKELIPIVAEKSKASTGKIIHPALYTLLIIIPITISVGIYSGTFYRFNHVSARFGVGIDPYQVPVDAIRFLQENQVNGRVINSLGVGGWLSWWKDEPVYIDGRLEVIQEEIYSELTESWNNGLAALISKYQPDYLFYNYLKYYPWTPQIRKMTGWKLVYLDGLFAVFVSDSTYPGIPEVKPDRLFKNFFSGQRSVPFNETESLIKRWITDGDDSAVICRNIGMFYLQRGEHQVAGLFMPETLKESRANNPSDQAIPGISGMKPSPENPDQEAAVGEFNKANDSYKARNIEDAIAGYTRAIKLYSSYSKAYNNRGIAYAMLNNLTDARKDFEMAISIDPTFIDAYVGRGSCRYYQGDREGACLDWQFAASRGNRQAKELLSQYCGKNNPQKR